MLNRLINVKLERKKRAFDVFIRAKRLGKTNLYFAKIHRKSPASITQALAGNNISLLNKIEKHIEILEKKNNNHGVKE